VDTPDAGAEVLIKIVHADALQDTSLPLSLQTGSHVYHQAIELHATGKYSIKVDYNGMNEASLDFDVN
jgi:hypothetical protein